MILLMQATGRAEIDQIVRQHIKPVEALETIEVHYCEKPHISKDFEAFILDYEKARALEETGMSELDSRQTRLHTSYAILDADPALIPNLYMKLYFTDNVVHCDVTDGGQRIILLLQGISPQEIQSAIRNQIRMMPGVLRIKQLSALNFSTK